MYRLVQTIIIPQDKTQTKVLVGVETQPKSDADAVLYQGYLDAGVVSATLEKLENQIGTVQLTHEPPLLTRLPDSEIIQSLSVCPEQFEFLESVVIQEWWPDSRRVPCGRRRTADRYDRSKLRYPSDLTDDEWALVEPLNPAGQARRQQAPRRRA